MRIYIVIPAYNEEVFIAKTLQSLIAQSFLPKKIVVVNDNSTDDTQKIVDSFSERHSIISSILNKSEAIHTPGSKVINAFNKGLESLDNNYDIICKFDADLIFPINYLEKIKDTFEKNHTYGMVGGFCYLEKNNNWVLESLTNKDHIRGALKAYRKECFLQIDGLKNTMGWDTVDELITQYHGWQVYTDESLQVKHLKPTGKVYAKVAKYKQGEAFYKMRYGFLLSSIASAKMSLKKKNIPFFYNSIIGYLKAKKNKIPFIVSDKEGVFIRKLRWKGIKKKLF